MKTSLSYAAHVGGYKTVQCLTLLAVMLFLSSVGRAQGTSYKYNFVKGFLTGLGYTVTVDKYCLMAPGETCSEYKTFSSGLDYKIVAFSDDEDVTDVDVYLYYSDGSLYTKDADRNALATVAIAPYTSTYLQVMWKNYASNTPRYKSNVYLMIGYK